MGLGEAIAVCSGVSNSELKRSSPGRFIWQPPLIDQGNLDLQHEPFCHHNVENTLIFPTAARQVEEEPGEIGSCTSFDIVDERQYKCSSQCRNSHSAGTQELPSSSSLHSPTAKMSAPNFVVGYALITKKIQSFLQPSLIAYAGSKGIVFTPIDRNRPLDEQGPFDVILHKISGDTWQQQLKAYKQKNPEVIILDPPEAIKVVYNRQSMLQEVAALNFHYRQGKVEVPKQLVVNGDSISIAEKVRKAGLRFPLVAKPLWIDGTAKSHALSLAFNETCLSELSPPLVLQEFVNHGGVLFKVYNFGDIVQVSRRFSLPDVGKDQFMKSGMVSFPRVSCAQNSADGADLDPRIGELPPKEMLESLCRALHCKLGLNLFNLDMIRENGKGDRYYVIDINYFPGYGKLPEYEKVFTEFLSSLAQRKRH